MKSLIFSSCYWRAIIFLFILLVTGCDLQQIPKIHSITSFEDVNFKEIPHESLVLFDVDETLIQPVDTYLINEHSDIGKTFKQKLVLNNPDIKDWDNLTSIIVLTAQRPLIEPNILTKITLLRHRNIPIIALTGMNTGQLGTIKKLEE